MQDLLFYFLSCIQKLAYLWIKSKSFPNTRQEVIEDLNVERVTYILRYRSWTDVLVLDYHCELLGLPRPLDPNKVKRAGLLYLGESGLLQKKSQKKIPEKIKKWLAKIGGYHTKYPLIPVSVFWGRDPGRKDHSLIKMIFFDDHQGGRWQRFFVFLVQGRQVYCDFAKPIDYQKLFENTEQDAEERAKKLRRLLKIHFRKKRNAVLGPNIYDRSYIIEQILSSKKVQDILLKEKTSDQSHRTELKSRKIADEIVANMSYQAIQFFDFFLTRLWKKVYDGVEIRGGNKLRELSERYSLVYVPCHRSHVDYLLLGHTLYHLGVMPPHTAAGVNLNFWPIGWFLRKGGAFFIRRTFKGDRLYSAVFEEYIHQLLASGFPLCFYPEGGRSRTGRLLSPKTGMLSSILSYCSKKTQIKEVLFIPVYIAYDRLMDGKNYVRELHGQAKKAESFLELMKIRKIFGTKWGKAYINFAEPLSYQENKESLKNEVALFSKRIMVSINQNANIPPMAFCAVFLLTIPSRAITEGEFLGLISAWRQVIYSIYPCSQEEQPWTNPQDMVRFAEQCFGLGRLKNSSGDVIYVSDLESVLLNYNRNNVIHLFFVPSLLANFLIHHESLELNQILEAGFILYEILHEELFLESLTEEKFKAIALNAIESMNNTGLVIFDKINEKLFRPLFVSSSFVNLRCGAYIFYDVLESYTLLLTLIYNLKNRKILRSDLEIQYRDLVVKVKLLAHGQFPNQLIERSFEDAFAVSMEYLKSSNIIEEFQNDEISLTRVGESKLSGCLRIMDPHIVHSLNRV